MTYQEKIQSICDKYGIRSFGCQQQDLAIFTDEELQDLDNCGLIYREMFTKEKIRRNGW